MGIGGGCVNRGLSPHPRQVKVIGKNGFNPIGSVKAGFFRTKIVCFTIDLIFEGISKIIPEKHPIRPVKPDENG
ncbi:MAG: hypothetical protein Q8S57_01755 [Methanoregula sp.]|nr:hypothetical protein [Methanoregula sp.]